MSRSNYACCLAEVNMKHKCSRYCEYCTHKNLGRDGSQALVDEAREIYEKRFTRLAESSSKKPADKRASRSCIRAEAAGKPARQALVAKRDHGATLTSEEDVRERERMTAEAKSAQIDSEPARGSGDPNRMQEEIIKLPTHCS